MRITSAIFPKKIKNLAQHCVNYINSIADKTDCSNKRFFPEIHDDDNDSTIDSQYIMPSLANKNNKIKDLKKKNTYLSLI